ncbi:hypothetical protein Gobs_1761 [Geodermatophilus obscurus DSM 43160]|uniref:Uncharacterized protein n=1 Tax=Geodermatophilus obscurus (strain ATCC 25078 / DSM 43160 / JCM 3152 / CCUG 61914 / KCC A-0152 / KCTC 9177 / NBRC 13315 / NRRL B-3577 / G-20) TaxID=526225 RepID=D2SDM0_GEOOG|nr:hypothetical protein Gobs_1761 [Geodermatophilus obscurus DSM 43160]
MPVDGFLGDVLDLPTVLGEQRQDVGRREHSLETRRR